jgi:hypothetical protein
VGKLKKMEELYQLSKSQNVEIVFRWVRVGIAARYHVTSKKCGSFIHMGTAFVVNTDP